MVLTSAIVPMRAAGRRSCSASLRWGSGPATAVPPLDVVELERRREPRIAGGKEGHTSRSPCQRSDEEAADGDEAGHIEDVEGRAIRRELRLDQPVQVDPVEEE